MNVIGVVFTAEFMRRIRSRSYVIATLIGAVSVIAITLLPKIFSGLGGSDKKLILVAEPAIAAAATPLLKRDFTITATLPRIDGVPDATFLQAHGKAGVLAQLTHDGRTLRVRVYARDPGSVRDPLRHDLAPLQIALGTRTPLADVQRYMAVPIEVRDIGGRFADAGAAMAAKGIAYLFVFLLYLSILLNSQAIMASVAEEKTSRIAELLVAAIDPAKLLAAKVLAAASTGVIQLAVWVGAGALAGRAVLGFFDQSAAAATGSGMDMGPLALPPGEVLSFIAFFIVGFVQYAVLYAAAASLINRTEDLGSVAGPLVIPVVLGFVFAQFGLESPNAPSVVVFSEIPLLSPFVMFTRIAVSAVPLWQIVLSLAINVGAAWGFAVLAGRVYRVGLLLYGRPPSFKQVVAALRA